MAGIILLIAGFFRLGRLIALIPEAVVNGFTIGIGIIIATSQIKDFLGLTIDKLPADFVEKVPALWAARDTFSLPAAGIALFTLVAIVALAALLMVTAWNMSEPHKWAIYAKERPSDIALLLVTLTLTVVVDLTVAIGVGVSIGLALRLYRRRQEVKSD